MRKSIYLLIVLLLIAVVVTGCSKPVKQTGTLLLSFSIPQGATEYPSLPSSERPLDFDLSEGVRQRPIPTGTTTLNVAVYNESTGFFRKVPIPVDSGQTTAITQVSNIPVGNGYTVEVIPANASSIAISIGRADDIVVQEGITTSAPLTVTKFDIAELSCPSVVYPVNPMAVELSLYSPVLLNSDDIDSVHYLLVQNLADPSAGTSFELHSSAALDLPANSWVDLTIEDVVPEDVVGIHYLLGAAMNYTQPVTNTVFYLFFALETPPIVDVEVVPTGAITIVVD